MNDPLQLRMFEPTDYATVCGWWQGHGWGTVPQNMLPKLGVIAFHQNAEDAAAGWLYMDNSCGVCMLEWLVTNPAIKGLRTARALKFLVSFLAMEATALGYVAMLTTCRQESLARFHENHGFEITDRDMIHMVKPLQEAA
jgi:hypothetical protein